MQTALKTEHFDAIIIWEDLPGGYVESLKSELVSSFPDIPVLIQDQPGPELESELSRIGSRIPQTPMLKAA
jgi:hypothetical protein